MRKLRVSFAVLLLFTLIFAVCGSYNVSRQNIVLTATMNTPQKAETTKKPLTYKIEEKTYTENSKITVTYPYIVLLNQSEQQDKINDMLKDWAFGEYNRYKGHTDQLTLEIGYSVHLSTSKFLSIGFSGYRSYKGSAYPVELNYSVNIDMETGERLRLTDLVNVDANLVKAFKAYQFGSDRRAYDYFQRLVSGTTEIDLINTFSNLDGDYNLSPSFYTLFNKDELIFIGFVPHVAGDYYTVSIKYADIADSIRTDNLIWQDILAQ